VLYELLLGMPAFSTNSTTDLMFRICHSRFTLPVTEIKTLPREGVDLLAGMLEAKPEYRISSIAEVRGRLAALRRHAGDRRSGR